MILINKLKNFKVSKMVFIMAALAVVFTSLIGFAGYIGINRMYKNIEAMHNDRVQPLAIGVGIRGEFANMRIETHKEIIKYDSKHDEEISKHKDKIQKYLEEYSKIKLDETETKNLNDFKNSYTAYLSIWEKANKTLISAGKMSDDDYAKMSEEASKGESALLNLKQYNIEKSDELDTQSREVYAASLRVFFILLSLVIVIFSFISYVVIKIIKASSNEMNEKLKTLATGDFTVKLETDSKNEFGEMKSTLSKMVQDISNMIKIVKGNSETIDSQAKSLSSISNEMSLSSENVTNAIQDVAQGTNAQSGDLVEITNILNSFGERINEIVKSIENVEITSNSIGDMAKESNSDMESLMQSIATVNDSFKDLIYKVDSLGNNIDKINEITNLINSIAGQTNLLALNASIEAARAGEQGKGFAVVAEEIRKLAEQSKASSQNIYMLINNTKNDKNVMIENTQIMSSELNDQVTVINSTISSFKKIVYAIHEIAPKIRAINMSAGGINSEKNSILQKIEQASAVSQEVSASSEEIVASTEELYASTEEVSSSAERLSSRTKEMMEQVDKFKL